MKSGKLRVLGVLVAVLALSLTAGGGGDDDMDARPKQSGSQSAVVASESPAESATGGSLDTGQSTTGEVEEGDVEVTYDVTARKVDFGTEAQAQALVQDKADAKGMALAAARVEVAHKAGASLTESFDANDGTAIWAGGKRGALLI